MSNQSFPNNRFHMVNGADQEARIAGEGKQLVADPVRLVGSSFGTAIDASFWTATTSAGGSSGVSTSVATVGSGPNNSGYGIMKSVRSGTFVAASPNTMHGYFRIPTVVVADCTRRWGLYTAATIVPTDGAYFELSGAGVLSVVTCRNSGPTPVASGSFNGKLGLTYVLDANQHAFYISVNTEEVMFFVDGYLLHRVMATNATLMRTRDLPVQFSSQNSVGGTTNGTLEAWEAIIERQGRATSAPQYRHISGANAAPGISCKLTPGVLQRIVNNSKLGGTATIYDGTAAGGVIIGILDCSVFGFLEYTCPTITGLTVVTTGESTDITVIYE
jgi:hypothetical protein